jgi:hypothetical protein
MKNWVVPAVAIVLILVGIFGPSRGQFSYTESCR